MAVIRRRRSSMWEAVRETPRDWLMQLIEDYELIDWNKVSEATSWPCALALNMLFILVSTARQLSPDGSAATGLTGRSLQRWDVVPGTSVAGEWRGTLLFLQLLLFGLSVGNGLWMFSMRRTYQMRLKGAESKVLSSNCRRVALGTRRPQWAGRWWGWMIWAVWKRVMGVDDSIQGEIWELSLWTPSVFARNLFCWFSPVQLLTLSFMNGSNWYYILPMAAAVASQCTVLTLAYATMVRDKQILFGEMHDEYNETFVNPRVFAPKQDAATSTMEDWAAEKRKVDAAAATASRAFLPQAAYNRPVAAPSYARDNRIGGRRTTMLTSLGGRVGRNPHYADLPPSPPGPVSYDRYGRRSSQLQNMDPAGSLKVRDRTESRRRQTQTMGNAADMYE
ncbi:hypothetical protein GGI20_000827 [Coemansia sp. BCRC 34301]|nr:hypothetical protein GGI20_000827 [Coemansia sp. BCRC 34301]